MRRFIHVFLFLFISYFLSAQDLPLYPNRFSFQIAEELQSGKLRNNRATWEYTYIGRQREAIETWGVGPEQRWGFDSLTVEQIAYFRTFEPVNAREEISRRAAKAQIIIINEAHHMARHRHFAKSLLPELYAAGFRYFGLETLPFCAILPENVPCDTNLNQRGYPLYSPFSGTYIQEPQMSRLIREAHQLGFELFAYDQFGGEARDSLQAINIKAILEKDPDARIVVHCGFGHNIEVADNESSTRGGRLMAYHLKEMTGIDPLTINQYILSEGRPDKEVELYRMINLSEPSVFIDHEDKLFSGWPGTDDRFDLLVYHPRTQYVFGRPVWLINEPGSQLYFPDKEKITIDYPIIFKAWPQGELETAAPIEVIEQSNEEENIPLVLRPGKYRIKLENPQNQSEEWFIELK